jgi:hypothetical protein
MKQATGLGRLLLWLLSGRRSPGRHHVPRMTFREQVETLDAIMHGGDK